MAIAVPGEFHESVGLVTNRALTAVCCRSVIFLQTIAQADVPWSAVWRGSRRSMDTNRCYRASECALERCLEGFAVLDGHKSMPSRELMCPGSPWNGDCRAR